MYIKSTPLFRFSKTYYVSKIFHSLMGKTTRKESSIISNSNLQDEAKRNDASQ